MFSFVLTFLTSEPRESSWAATTPRLVVTGHPRAALTTPGTGRAVEPRKAGWWSVEGNPIISGKSSILPHSCHCSFFIPLPPHTSTHVCHTWLPSSLADTHSDPSCGGNWNCGHSRTSARSGPRRIPQNRLQRNTRAFVIRMNSSHGYWRSATTDSSCGKRASLSICLSMSMCGHREVLNSPDWQFSPIQPGRHRHFPVTLSQLPPFKHPHVCVQFSP